MGFDFLKAQEELYPEKAIFSHDDKLVVFETREVFKFAAFRRILIQEWDIDRNGPQI